MRLMLSTMCFAAMCGMAIPAAAQSGATPPGQPPGQMDKKMMDGPMTVTGCVAAGAGAGQYMLTNATTAMSMMDKDKMPMDKDKMPMGKDTMSYMLMGGTDLKAHLGHKVEVMGSMAKSDMSKMPDQDRMAKMDKEKMDKDKMGKDMMGKDMMGGTLTVTSVKMVSATCP